MKYDTVELAEIQLDFGQIRGGKVARLFSLMKATNQSTSQKICSEKKMEKKMSENKKKVGIPKVGKTISEVQEEFGKTLEERSTLALERIADSASALVLKPCIALVGGQMFEMDAQVMWTGFSVVAAIILATSLNKTT